MAATDFQKEIARLLAVNRSAKSYFYGSFVLFHEEGRQPGDIDILFCGDIDELYLNVESDQDILENNGIRILKVVPNDFAYGMEIAKGEEKFWLNWIGFKTQRFFPPASHKDYGFMAHPFDVIAHKLRAILMGQEDKALSYNDLLTIKRPLLLAAAIASVGTAETTSYQELIDTLSKQRARMNPADTRLPFLKELEDAIMPLTTGKIPPELGGYVFTNAQGEIFAPKAKGAKTPSKHPNKHAPVNTRNPFPS